MVNEEIIIFEDMYQAYEDCRRRKKSTPGAKKFEARAFYNLDTLIDEIMSRRYKLMPSQCFVIKYPVPREVFCAAFRDRVVQHFVFNELNPIVERRLVRDTASCRVGKGTDYAIDRLKCFVRRETNNYTEEAFYGKGDLSGFFMHLNRYKILDDMLDIVDNYYEGRYPDTLRYLLEIIILTDVTKYVQRLSPESDWDLIPSNKTLFGNDHGLPIGNITSQMFANYYLNDLDHLNKSRHKSYVRYVDDFIIVNQDRDYIFETFDLIAEYLPEIDQALNEKKTTVQNVKYGIPFLGVIVKPHYSVLSPKRINRIYYTSSDIEDPEDFYRSANSRKGMFERYNGHGVAERWYDSQSDLIKEEIAMDENCKFTRRKKSEKQTELLTL